MDNNTKCSECGSEDIKKVMTNSGFVSAKDNSLLQSSSTPIYECKKCGHKFNDFLDIYSD